MARFISSQQHLATWLGALVAAFASAIAPISAQVTVTPSAPLALSVACVSSTGALSFDVNSNTTCAGPQTGITSIAVNNGAGFVATGTAGVTVSGTGSISTTSGNITSATGTVQGAILTSTGVTNVGTTLTVGGNTSIGGNLDMTSGAISNVTNLSGTGTISGFSSVSATTVNATTGNITNVNSSSVTATGAVTGGSLTDGTATLSGGNLAGVGTLTATTGNIANVNATTVNATSVVASGTVRGSTVTDGTVVITGGNVTGATTVSAQTVTSTTVNAATTNTTGTTTTGRLNVGSGGVTVASGAPINVGGNRIQNVGAPVAATDGVNRAYVDALAMGSNEQINEAFRRIDKNSQGVALAIALGGLVLPQGKTFAIGANMGFFDGKEAMATQMALRLSDQVIINAGVGFSIDGGTVGSRFGISAAW